MDNNNQYGLICLTIFGIIICAGIACYKMGYKSAETDLYHTWETEKLELIKEANEKNHEYRQEISKLKDELFTNKQQYEKNLNDIKYATANQLQQSENRAQVYRDQAQSGEVERNRLAEHTAQLDRALSEAITLVKEFRTTTEQLQSIIEILVKRLQAEQKLAG